MTNFKHPPSQCHSGRQESGWHGGGGRPAPTSAKSGVCAFALGLSLVFGGPARAVVIAFVDVPPVVVVNEPVSLRVGIDHGSSGTSALFSYGLTVVGNWDEMDAVPLGVVVPAALDFNGVAGPGAVIGIDDASIGVKGTVNLSANPIVMYAGAALADFRFQFTQPGSYELRLDFFNTLGPTEDIFVNQDGLAIDDEIEFGSTRLQVVIPEPETTALAMAALVALGMRRRRVGGR